MATPRDRSTPPVPSTSSSSAAPITDRSSAFRSFGNSLGVDMVDIYVGPYKEYYRVHRSILSSKVEYFDLMFTNGFKETSDQSATIPELEPSAFDLLLHWAYRGFLPPLLFVVGPTDICPSLIDLYGWGECTCSFVLMNEIMALFHETFRRRPEYFTMFGVGHIYRVTGSAISPLRRWASSEVCRRMELEPEQYAGNLEEVMRQEPDIAIDLVLLKQGKAELPVDPRTLPICDFHVHGKDEECKQKYSPIPTWVHNQLA